MRILLDEDVHVKVLDWLAKAGHDVIRVPSGLKNGRVLAVALQESRFLLTRDKDFSNRLMYPPKNFPGIVILRIHPPVLEKLVHALSLLLNDVSEKQLSHKLVIIEEDGYHLLS